MFQDPFVGYRHHYQKNYDHFVLLKSVLQSLIPSHSIIIIEVKDALLDTMKVIGYGKVTMCSGFDKKTFFAVSLFLLLI